MRGDHLGRCPRDHPKASNRHVWHRPSPEAASSVLSTHAFIKRTCNTYKTVDPGVGSTSTLARHMHSWPHHKTDRLWTGTDRGAPSGTDRFCCPNSYTCCRIGTHACCVIQHIDHVPQNPPRKQTTPSPSQQTLGCRRRPKWSWHNTNTVQTTHNMHQNSSYIPNVVMQTPHIVAVKLLSHHDGDTNTAMQTQQPQA